MVLYLQNYETALDTFYDFKFVDDLNEFSTPDVGLDLALTTVKRLLIVCAHRFYCFKFIFVCNGVFQVALSYFAII